MTDPSVVDAPDDRRPPTPAFFEAGGRLIDQLRAARTTAATMVALAPLHEAGFASDIRSRIVDLLDALDLVDDTEPATLGCRCCDHAPTAS